MDLFAVWPTSPMARHGLSANIATWAALRELLEQLACDISEMSFFNNGDRVRAATARAWAKALRGALPEIRRFTVKRAIFPVFEVHLCLQGRENLAISRFSAATRKAIRKYGYRVDWLERDERAELNRFCRFFETSGGFRQH